MEKYITEKQETFFFNPDAFSVETITELVNIAKKKDGDIKTVEIMSFKELKSACMVNKNEYSFDGIILSKNASIEDVFHSVFSDVSHDADIGINAIANEYQQAEQISYTDAIDKAKAHVYFSEKDGYVTTASPFNQDLVDPEIEKVNENHERYNEVISGEIVSIYVGETMMFQYNKSEVNEGVQSVLSDIMKWAVVFFDVLTIGCTIAGIWSPKASSKNMGKIATILKNCWDKVKSLINKAKDIINKQSWAEKAKSIISFLMAVIKVGMPLKDIVKAFFTGAKWWKYLFYVATLVGNIILLCISSGASLAAKLVKLTIQMGLLVKDILKAVNVLEKPSELSLQPE